MTPSAENAYIIYHFVWPHRSIAASLVYGFSLPAYQLDWTTVELHSQLKR
jgi:hypothetical protein